MAMFKEWQKKDYPK